MASSLMSFIYIVKCILLIPSYVFVDANIHISSISYIMT